jgi:dipeptidase E
MRLYLSSLGLGNKADKLLEMVGAARRVAVIANACDFRIAERNDRLEREIADLQRIGLEPVELDLRDYFDTKFQASDLLGYGMVWVRGGNAFILRRAMKQSGFDVAITQVLNGDNLVYGGYSAGTCVLAPDLHGIELCDDPNQVPDGYQPEVVWEGLGLINYAIAPHYKSDHPESAKIDKVVDYFEHNDIPYTALSDGEVVIVNTEAA